MPDESESKLEFTVEQGDEMIAPFPLKSLLALDY